MSLSAVDEDKGKCGSAAKWGRDTGNIEALNATFILLTLALKDPRTLRPGGQAGLRRTCSRWRRIVLGHINKLDVHKSKGLRGVPVSAERAALIALPAHSMAAESSRPLGKEPEDSKRANVAAVCRREELQASQPLLHH